MEPNNTLTASRMNGFLRCQRASYWGSEVGLVKDEAFLALRFGSAWARGMDARWEGHDYDSALAFAIPEGIDLPAYDTHKLAAMLAGYYDYWGPIEDCAKIHPEVQFSYDLGLGFKVEGKLDGLGTGTDGLSVIVEGKTTGESISHHSDYWLRLAFNMQLYQYVCAARQYGWDVSRVIYDVVRKPGIKPRMIQDVDSSGKKIVTGMDGKRVMLKAGKNKGEPKQSADGSKGETIKEHRETPEEFSDRLWKDTRMRPDFYFARREVPILDDQVDAFIAQRLSIARSILFLREQSQTLLRPEDAWPRNVGESTCNFCSYKSFCLAGISVDPSNPPEGFTIKAHNQELSHEYSTTEESGTNDNADATA